jgi:predicted metalloprotease
VAWLKSTWGIVTIAAIAVVLVGGIAYFAFFYEDGPEDLEWAADDIDGFWEGQSEASGFEYVDPKDVVYYTEEEETPCGPTIPNNAFYCSPSHSIYLDLTFLEQQEAEVGRYAPIYILAHEWGHLIQDDLGILEGGNFSIQVELQADCFAGAYTKDLEERDDRFTDTDLEAAVIQLIQVADPALYPWFAPGAHGDAEQRVTSFKVGYDGGYDPCTKAPFAQPAIDP